MANHAPTRILADYTPPRILDVDPAQATPQQLKFIEHAEMGRGRLMMPYRIWLHCPEAAEGMEKAGSYLTSQASLSYAEAEIVILQVAVFWRGAFAINAHTNHSRNAGIDEANITCMLEGRKPSFKDERSNLIYLFASSALAKKKLSDADFAQCEDVLTRKGIAEILMLIGYYTAVVLSMTTHDVEPQSVSGS